MNNQRKVRERGPIPRSWLLGLTVASLAFALAMAGCGSSSSTTTNSEQDVVAKAKPATVLIYGKSEQGSFSGSGVVYDAANGRILTAAHVVQGLSGIKVKIGDQLPAVSAHVVGTAPCDDLAVVQLSQPPADLTQLPLGDSDTVQSGQHVTVLGYPVSAQRFLQATVSSSDGAVSNPKVIGNAPDPFDPRFPNLIAQQAPVNHGDSGGPLVNDDVQVIGINVFSLSGNQGQYYAIASNQAKALLPELEAGGTTSDLGWSVAPISAIPPQQLAADFKSNYGASAIPKVINYEQQQLRGLYVQSVDPGSPAAKGQVYPGASITKINGNPVNSVPGMCRILNSAAPGSTLRVDNVIVNDGKDFSRDFGQPAPTKQVKVPEEPVATTTTTATTSTTP